MYLRTVGLMLAAMVPFAVPLLAQSSGGKVEQVRTLWEWQSSQGAVPWEANGQITDLLETPEGLSFRTTGGDPIMSLPPVLNIPASPWQAFEVTMKADQPGQMELFWTETTEGPYGGFSGEKSSQFAVVGDGQWHTYRVFPFWQKAQRIIRMRFDPFGGARFVLRSMRVIEWPHPAGKTVLVMPRDAGLMVPVYHAAASPTAGGLVLTQTAPGGFALAPLPDIEAEVLPCISVEATANAATRATVLFASDSAFGPQEIPLNLIGDGKPHVYNLDGLGHPQWKGRIVAIGIRPNGRLTLRSLRVSATPLGPADVRIQSFDAEEAVPRAGRPFRLTARVSNLGGAPSKRGDAVFELPAGARAAGGTQTQRGGRTVRAPLEPLQYGAEQTLTCRVVCARPGEYSIVLRMPAAVGSHTASCRVKVTPRPNVAATGYPPEPHPVSGKIDVGVYYFPGWRTAGQWAPITRFPERRPVLGWYREGDPSVADWHIKWAVEHGIKFFAYDWYWTAGSRMLEHALHEGLFNARYRKDLKFCLLWANHNPPQTSSHDDFMAVVRYWIENYFRRPEYYTIEGKPVVIIFTPHRFRADMGSEAVRRSFEDMRAECRKAGLPGLYLIACVGGDITENGAAAAEGYDAISAYNWPGLGLPANQTVAPYADLLEPHRLHWERMAGAGPLPIMTPISGGWDSRPWHGDTAMVRSGRTPDLFRKHLLDARRFIETHPDKALPVALIEAWNEFGEGSYIEPTREFGFGYLDAVREVFTDAPAAHVDLTPADVGHEPPQVNVVAAMGGQWDLSKEPSGWDSGMNLTDIHVADGALQARTTTDDPAFFGPPIQVHASRLRTLVLRMRLTPPPGREGDDTAQVFWSTRSSGTSEAASIRFPVSIDGQWHTYRVDLSKNLRWRGIVTSLRLDPCNRSDIAVAISSIRLE